MGSRLDELKRKLAAREGKSEYKDNCTALRAEITRLEEKAAKRDALKDFLNENR